MESKILESADIGEMTIVALAARDSGFERVQVEPRDMISILEMLQTSQAWQVVQKMAAERNAHKKTAEKALASNGKLAAEIELERARNRQLTDMLDAGMHSAVAIRGGSAALTSPMAGPGCAGASSLTSRIAGAPPFDWTDADIARLVPGSKVTVLEDDEAHVCVVKSVDGTLVEFAAGSYWTCATLHCCAPKSVRPPTAHAKQDAWEVL